MTALSITPMFSGFAPQALTFEVVGAPTIDELGRVVWPAATEVELTAPIHVASDRKRLERIPGYDAKREVQVVYLTGAQWQQLAGASKELVLQYDGHRYEQLAVSDHIHAADSVLWMGAKLDEVGS